MTNKKIIKQEKFLKILFDIFIKGTGPEVPAYLRYEGPVRNRKIGKRDTALLIRDIWREKSDQDAKVSRLQKFL